MSSERKGSNALSPPRRDHELDRRYGAIGISAVAAAVRCQNLGKKLSRTHEDEERPARVAGVAPQRSSL
jgi:hypothetical protein